MKPLLAIIRKDLKLHFRNRRAVMITMIIPIVIASFFGFIMGGASGSPKTSGVPILIVDQDESPASKEIVEHLLANERLKGAVTNEAGARQAVINGKIAVAVVFPKGFAERSIRALFQPETGPELRIYQDPSHGMESGFVQGFLMQEIMQTIGRRGFSGEEGRKVLKESLDVIKSGSGLSQEDSAALVEFLTSAEKWMKRNASGTGQAMPGSGGFKIPFEVRTEKLTQSKEVQFNGYAHSFGGMAMQFLLMGGIEWGVVLLADRQRGLWRRLRSAPISKGAVLGGRAVSGTFIGTLTMAASWIFAILVFKVRVEGSWIGFIGCNIGIAMLTVSIGLFLAAFGNNPEATRGLSIFAILLLLMLGGVWMPSFLFPEWLQKVTLVLPTRWAIDGLDAMTWRGLGLGVALQSMAVTMGYAVLLGGLAVWRFRWEE